MYISYNISILLLSLYIYPVQFQVYVMMFGVWQFYSFAHKGLELRISQNQNFVYVKVCFQFSIWKSSFRFMPIFN